MVERRTFAGCFREFRRELGTVAVLVPLCSCSTAREDVPLTGRCLHDG